MELLGILAAVTSTSSGLHSVNSFPEVLVGRWTTQAIHLHSDGNRSEEAGTVACEWILERTHVRCDRTHKEPRGRERRSMQIYSPQTNGALDVQTFYAGRAVRVLQRAVSSEGQSLALHGDVPLPGGLILKTRGRFTVPADGRLRYENDSEETPGKWRTDYVETYVRAGQ